MRVELERLRAGTLTPDLFFAQTRGEWERIATRLVGRWSVPAGVELQDVVQELMMAAWRMAPAYDESRGSSFDRYVIFNAIDKAKKWMHAQRAALRRDDRSPSRHPVRFRLQEGQDLQAVMDGCLAPSLPATEAVELRMAVAKGATTSRPRDRYILATVLELGVDATVERLMADDLFLVTNRFSTKRDVERCVHGIILTAAQGSEYCDGDDR